eukprot:CAMPEP_0171811304 /NCGR_PEP_ID=MMETSP0991-20121206/78028_1 /TAXON_ID=483369 /ORGANISM="non described non described, Strain CCMP2098" /LENGTH=76 /DNA_ID=CAMNT_0012424645 /DNA_START=145 /DNA_END=371 /DNA_ORIENTATION=+
MNSTNEPPKTRRRVDDGFEVLHSPQPSPSLLYEMPETSKSPDSKHTYDTDFYLQNYNGQAPRASNFSLSSSSSSSS